MTYRLTSSIHVRATVYYSQFEAVENCVYAMSVCVKLSGTAKRKSVL
jgi:hypothetical protein